jgi:hypothetical protein
VPTPELPEANTVPPVIATASAFWVAIVPKPKLVLALGAVVAPVPPLETGKVPEVILEASKSGISAAVIAAETNLVPLPLKNLMKY